MKQLVVIFTLWLVWMPVGAQKTLTLEECLKLGIENNLSLEGSRNEMRKAKHLLSENRAKLWPQISAVAGFNDNFNPPVSVTDGSAYGNLYNVTKTLQYNASAGLQLQMPLYNQTVYTAVDIARTLNELNRLSYEKAREDLMMQISKMYYLGQPRRCSAAWACSWRCRSCADSRGRAASRKSGSVPSHSPWPA